MYVRFLSKTPRFLVHPVVCVVLSLLIGSLDLANAALYSADNGLAVYDSDQNITWLANANLAATNTFGLPQLSTNNTYVTGSIYTDGEMDWATAQSWIAAMNSANYLGINSWRLPVTTQPDPSCSNQYNYTTSVPPQGYGLGCSGSELGNLFYDGLGGAAGQSIDAVHNSSYALFSNIALDDHWSATQWYDPQYSMAWILDFSLGYQDVDDEDGFHFASAVTSGDPFNAIPLPSAIWLLGSALGVLSLKKRR